jgi:two-component sensor histidine kinase
MILFTPELKLLFINAAHERMTGKSAAEVIGKEMFEAFPPNPGDGKGSAEIAMRKAVGQIVATCKPRELSELQHDLVDEDGRYEQRFFNAVHWPVKLGGQVVAILQRSEDVTDKVRERRLTLTLRRAAEQTSGLSFFSFDPDRNVFERGRGIDEMFGLAPGEADDRASAFFDRVHPDDLPGVHEEVSRAMAEGAGAIASFDYRVVVPNEKELRHVRVRAGIERDPDDGWLKLFGAFIDMTDIERAREKLQQLSDRNEALVVESNHRIKNSLAIASAMLSQQVRASENEEVHQALQIAATRIAAIADVHGKLFQDHGVEQVDAGGLIEQFVKSFTRTIGQGGSAGLCRIDVRTQPVELASRWAVTLALTLNELLTNAVKYGMAADETCEVGVELSLDGNRVTLRVTNGIPDTPVTHIASQGVGTRLVKAFARQLNATLDAGRREGCYEVRFSFPLPNAGSPKAGEE